MTDINTLQKDLQAWQAENFPPENRTLELLTLGVCEEAGELAHAVLKSKQGIRNMGEADIIDACCDTIIYSLQVLSAMNVQAGPALSSTATQVMKRNWKKEGK